MQHHFFKGYSIINIIVIILNLEKLTSLPHLDYVQLYQKVTEY